MIGITDPSQRSVKNLYQKWGRQARIAISISCALAATIALSSSPLAAAETKSSSTRPKLKLIVVISVDQLRADLLTRFDDRFLPAAPQGGFRRLIERGSYYPYARYEHYPLLTGPGHAVILTGAPPASSGIVDNEWWDRATRKTVYCVDDPDAKVVGAAAGSKAKPMGPSRLRVTTVGDELKLATSAHAKVVAISLKDRAAILLAGHSADLALWYDTFDGRWITSSSYAPSGALPPWVQRLNDEQIAARRYPLVWTAQLPASILNARSFEPAVLEGPGPYGIGRRFPHTIEAANSARSTALMLLPQGNQAVFDAALAAVVNERLGDDDVPDMLELNLATNDYAAHAFGPYSPEVAEITVDTDRRLAGFMTALEAKIAGGAASIVYVLTADHGGGAIPEDLQQQSWRIPAGRVDPKQAMKLVEERLVTQFGKCPCGDWTAAAGDASRGALIDGQLFLSPDAIDAALLGGKAKAREEIERAGCEALIGKLDGIQDCFGRTQLRLGQVAPTEFAARLASGIDPVLSGDLILIPRPQHLIEPAEPAYMANHKSGWAYDTTVPIIIAGPGVRRGRHYEPASPSSIAATLSALLGISPPSGSERGPLANCLDPE